uniref:Protein kinase domain-containing protein n=1 Tax=Thermogemmatispora argillosa TaxID=2045280 RepID=A0A455T260_9CHLR|nr:hypothetical protein KTA_15800 [Thermogemmatispora argillosa]
MFPDLSGQHLDHYHLLRLLGTGSVGQVYLAEDQRHSPPLQVALKLLFAFQLAPDDLSAFLNEVRASLRLRHPHIVPLLDLGFDPQRFLPFLVMAFAPGGSLRQRLPRGSRLPLGTVLDYVAQLSSALQYAHDAGVIHRDLKPDNVLLDAQDCLLLGDFGIAQLTSTFGTSLRSNSSIQGTPIYMAPEQFQGQPRRASDQYSLAVMAYEWLCGSPPFLGTFMELVGQHLHTPPPTLHERAPELEIPPAVEQVLMRALAKRPAERFPSVQDFAAAFQQAAALSLPPEDPTTIVCPPDSTSTQAQPPSPVADLLGQGQAYLGQQRFNEALTCFNEAIRLDPTSVAAYINRGILYQQQGQLKLALSDFNQAIRLDPASVVAYINRGVLYQQQGQLKLALSDFNQAIRLDPASVAAYINRGVLYQQQGQLELALADFNQAIHLAPSFALAYYNRSTLYARQGRFDLALADLNEALRLQPAFAAAYNNRGLLYQQRGQFDSALADLNEALRLQPTFAAAYTNRGLLYRQRGQLELALADLEKAQRLQPTNRVIAEILREVRQALKRAEARSVGK